MTYAGGEIWAIDPATKTGLACGEPGGTPILSVHKFREYREESQHTIFERAHRFIRKRIELRKPALLAIEDPVPPHGAAGRTTFDVTTTLLGLRAIFIGAALDYGVQVLGAPIGSWRKYFIGVGNLKGDEAKAQCLALCTQLKWSPPDHNAAEAGGIWLWACAQVAPTRTQRVEPFFARLKGEVK